MKIEKIETIFNGFYSLRKIFLRSKRTNDLIEREQLKVPNSIGILVYDTKKKKIILVKQFRVGPEKELVEIVAGKIEDETEPIEIAAKREVMEEVGYSIDNLQLIHQFHTCPGPVTEMMNLFYAEVSNQIESGGGVASEHEEIEILELSIQDFLLDKYIDAKTIIAQQWLTLKNTK